MLGNRWVFIALGVATILALLLARRGDGDADPTPHGHCLTTRDCLKGEVCVVTPKGDGFATIGQCSNDCTLDTDCLNGWRCVPWTDTGTYLVTPGTAAAKESKGAQRQACAPPSK